MPDRDNIDDTTPLEKFLEVTGDYLFVAPAVATADAHSGKPVNKELTFFCKDYKKELKKNEKHY